MLRCIPSIKYRVTLNSKIEESFFIVHFESISGRVARCKSWLKQGLIKGRVWSLTEQVAEKVESASFYLIMDDIFTKERNTHFDLLIIAKRNRILWTFD